MLYAKPHDSGRRSTDYWALPVPIILYDRNGNAVAYSEDGCHVYLCDGQPIAYLEENALYSYPGELLGWFEDGWLRDKDGRCVAFADEATGGPPRPAIMIKALQLLKHPLPLELIRDRMTLRPIHSNAWSEQTALDFFHQKPQPWPGELGDVLPDRRLDRRRQRRRRHPMDPPE